MNLRHPLKESTQVLASVELKHDDSTKIIKVRSKIEKIVSRILKFLYCSIKVCMSKAVNYNVIEYLLFMMDD